MQNHDESLWGSIYLWIKWFILDAPQEHAAKVLSVVCMLIIFHIIGSFLFNIGSFFIKEIRRKIKEIRRKKEGTKQVPREQTRFQKIISALRKAFFRIFSAPYKTISGIFSALSKTFFGEGTTIGSAELIAIAVVLVGLMQVKQEDKSAPSEQGIFASKLEIELNKRELSRLLVQLDIELSRAPEDSQQSKEINKLKKMSSNLLSRLNELEGNPQPPDVTELNAVLITLVEMGKARESEKLNTQLDRVNECLKQIAIKIGSVQETLDDKL